MAELAKKIDKRIEGYATVVVKAGAPREAVVADLQTLWTQFKAGQGMETDALETVLRSRNLIACECGEMIAMGSPIPDHPVLLVVKCLSCGKPVRTFEAIKAGLEKQIAQLEAKEREITCVYCGHHYGPVKLGVQDEVLTAHVESCMAHPLFAARERIAELEKNLGEMQENPDAKD